MICAIKKKLTAFICIWNYYFSSATKKEKILIIMQFHVISVLMILYMYIIFVVKSSWLENCFVFWIRYPVLYCISWASVAYWYSNAPVWQRSVGRLIFRQLFNHEYTWSSGITKNYRYIIYICMKIQEEICVILWLFLARLSSFLGHILFFDIFSYSKDYSLWKKKKMFENYV